MRLTHSARLAALLAPLILANPLAAQIPGGLRTTPRTQAPGNGTTVIIWARHLQTLQARLDSFAVALPAEERALWDGVLLRAAHAPTPAAAEVRVSPVLEIGPGGGCEDSPGTTEAANRVAIIIQGGRTAGASGIIVQGGRTATPSEGIVVQGGRTATPNEGIVVQGGRTASPATGIVVQGGRTSGDVRRPTDAVGIGPKPEDPTRPPPESLARRVADLSLRLSGEERATLEWLLTRAATAPEGRAGSTVALPPGPCNPERGCRAPVAGSPLNVSLRQALGIDALSAGTRQGARTEERWILRF